MKVHVSDDEWFFARYSRHEGASSHREPIDVPDEIIAEYDAALAAFEVAVAKLEAVALPIYAARRAEAMKNAPPYRPFKWPKYKVPEDLSAKIERALFHG